MLIKRLLAVAQLLGALWMLMATVAIADDPPFRVGVSRIDITPDYPIRLSGFGYRRAESEGVTQRIYARALAISDLQGSLAVLITVDTCGVPGRLTQQVAERLSDLGIAENNLCLASTHTHTAPMLAGVLPTLFGEPIPLDHRERIERYTGELVLQLERVARRAIESMQPAHLSTSVGHVDFARNRRQSDGPVDHDLLNLIVRDAQGQLLAVHTTYACHCVTMSDNKISGDWAGAAAEWIEKEWPGAVGLVSIGCGADQNPSSGVTGDRWDAAQQQGLQIVEEVRRMLDQPSVVLTGKLHTSRQTIRLPLAPPRTRDEWQQRAQQGGAVGYHAQIQLDRLAVGIPLQEDLAYPIHVWKFGDQLAYVFLPGEVVVDYALRLKRSFGSERLCVCAYANDAACYIPSERVLQEGGYEGEGAMVYYDLPQKFAPGIEQAIVSEIERQLAPEFLPLTHDEGSRQWNDPTSPPSPESIMASLHTAPGFRIELAASEPQIADPVAVAFGTNGELWVCQMSDYPTGTAGDYQAGGSIRVLRDADRDGYYETGATFLEGIPFPTGVLPWRDGVLICAAPDILFASDTSGDGRADRVEQWFTGFATHNYQARVNSLRYGLDGWVYGSCGLFGGEITGHRGGPAVSIQGRDFRIRPDEGVIEAVTGQTQHGRSRNDWGDWFGCDNSMLARHYPLVESYVARNPFWLPPPSALPVSLEADPQLIFGSSQATLLPRSGPGNRVTAACGLSIYRDDLFGPEWSGDIFCCEPVGNLVHHMRLESRGATFAGRRLPAQQRGEFLVSESPWFRPVEALTGPDGALWVVDMCRWVIEHPQWIPSEVLATLDVRAGDKAGRIFRVFPSMQTPRPFRALVPMDGPGLAEMIDSPNGVQRDLAMQLILWRADSTAGDKLREVVQGSVYPAARMQAMVTLSQLGQLTHDDICSALRDEHPGVRRHAVRIAEDVPDLNDLLCRMVPQEVSGDLPLVQQLAWSIGSWKGPQSDQALATILVNYPADPYVVAAVFSSFTAERSREVWRLVSEAVDRKESRLPDELVANWIGLSAQWDSNFAAQQLGEYLRINDDQTPHFSIERMSQIAAVFENQGIPQATRQRTFAAAVLDDAFEIIHRAVDNDSFPIGTRVQAVRLLGFRVAEQTQDEQQLLSLMEPHFSGELQLAAMEALDRARGAAGLTKVLDRWNYLTPQVRESLLSRLLTTAQGTLFVLQAIERGFFSWGVLDAPRRQQIMNYEDAEVRQALSQVVRNPDNGNRGEVIQQLTGKLSGRGDRERGRAVFRQSCASCHAAEGQGHNLGPDLAALADRSPATLLKSILDPSATVDPRYIQYIAVTIDGRTLSGMLVDESYNGFTLVGQNNERHVLNRAYLEAFRSTEKSFMPDGLEKDWSPQDIDDLLIYLRDLHQAPKSFVGNQPSLGTANAEGVIELTASDAAIYGQDIEYEAGPRAIGCWHGENDFVVWACVVPHRRRYEVFLEYSCAPHAAGNVFVLEAGTQTLKFEVVSTGGWGEFRSVSLGTLLFDAGRQNVVARCQPPLTRPALLDLRSIRLSPQ